MDRLPREARDFLTQVADAHDPPDAAARERVQARLAALALLPAPRPAGSVLRDLAAQTGAPATGGWLASSKLLATGALALVLGGALWSLAPARPAPSAQPRASSHEASPATLPARDAPPESAPLPSEPQHAEVFSTPLPVAAAASPTHGRPARLERASASASTLVEEAALLQRASEQLAQRELDSALRLLALHRRRYRSSQLAEERAGLLLLARCLRDPRAAVEQARSFVARAPGSLLVPRLVSACAL